MPSKHAIGLADDVQDVLRRSVIANNALTLPAGQLDRDLYSRVDKVLKACGGKWNRGAKAHLFPSDPREVLGLALDAGEIIDQKKAKQQFFTPEDVVHRLLMLAIIEPGMRLLEPSAGRGAIASRARTMFGARVDCIEIDPVLSAELVKHGFDSVLPTDFLTVPYPDKEYNRYDRVVMNPPFEKHQDIDHVLHAFKFLKEGGRLVSVMSAGVKFNSDKKTTAFRSFVETLGGRFVDLDDEAFKESGTLVRTVAVVFDKPELHG